MKVKALKKFETIKDKTINRVRKEGEVFEVDEKRAELLLKNELIEIINEIKEEVEEAVEEKPKKKSAKKK